MRFIILCPLILLSQIAIGRCDSSFYQLKRSIIKNVSAAVDSVDKFKPDKNNLYIEYSDYKINSYLTSSGGYLGFLVSRDSVCNNFSDSACIKVNTVKGVDIWGYEKSYYDSFKLVLNEGICQIYNHRNIYYKIINDPINNWFNLEYLFFLNSRQPDIRPERSQTIQLIFPVYQYIDAEIAKMFISIVDVYYLNGFIIKNTSTKNVYTFKRH